MDASEKCRCKKPFLNRVSVKVKIVPRLKFETLFWLIKPQHCIRSDAADRLHLMCCGSQKSMESPPTLLHAKRSQKDTPEISPAPEKLGTILTQPRRIGIRVQYDARRRAKTCSQTPPDMKEYPRVIESMVSWPARGKKKHEVGPLFRKIFLKGHRESFSDCENPSGEQP